MRMITPFTLFQIALKICMLLCIIYVTIHKFGVSAVQWPLLEKFIPNCFYSWVSVFLLAVGLVS